MTRKHLLVNLEDLVSRYIAGESVKALAESFGVSRQWITETLIRLEVPVRGRSEAMYTRMANATPEERARLSAAAHDAVRGVKRTEASLEAFAAARERKGIGKRSPAEVELGKMLRAQGLDITHEKAVGKYNVDIATSSVAVEVLGGGWHGVKPHGERLRHLLNRGWDVIYIWVNPIDFPLGPEAAQYVIAHAKFRERNPSMARCYRVIRGTGQFIAGGSADGDNIPDILPYTDRPYIGPAEVPFGCCHCGCGRKTTIIPQTGTARGLVRGQPHRYISGHNRHRNPR